VAAATVSLINGVIRYGWAGSVNGVVILAIIFIYKIKTCYNLAKEQKLLELKNQEN